MRVSIVRPDKQNQSKRCWVILMLSIPIASTPNILSNWHFKCCGIFMVNVVLPPKLLQSIPKVNWMSFFPSFSPFLSHRFSISASNQTKTSLPKFTKCDTIRKERKTMIETWRVHVTVSHTQQFNSKIFATLVCDAHTHIYIQYTHMHQFKIIHLH